MCYKNHCSQQHVMQSPHALKNRVPQALAHAESGPLPLACCSTVYARAANAVLLTANMRIHKHTNLPCSAVIKKEGTTPPAMILDIFGKRRNGCSHSEAAQPCQPPNNPPCTATAASCYGCSRRCCAAGIATRRGTRSCSKRPPLSI